jgi:hypothetical protein
MITIQGLSSNPIQTFQTVSEDGSIIDITIRYHASSSMWFANISTEDFTVNGLRLCASNNLLRQYKNIIDFGLLVSAPEGTEPILINDFATGRCTLNILSAADVVQLESLYVEANQ